MYITLKNDFHNTEVKLQARINGGVPWLSKKKLDKAHKKLCGIKNCTCGGYAGERGKQRFLLDYIYSGNMDVKGAMVIDTYSLMQPPSPLDTFLMNPYTGTVQTLDDWRSDFSTIYPDEETEFYLIEVVPDGSGWWIEKDLEPF